MTVGEREPAGPPPPLHAASFKLRFASSRELGRSYVSSVRPRGLPATVADQSYGREREPADERRAKDALARIDRMFAQGPKDKYAFPVLSSHEYGWHCEAAARMHCAPAGDRRLQHHLRDSAWLKGRLRVLAADLRLQRR